MRVGILTNLDADCGNAQHARELASALSPFDVKLSIDPGALLGSEAVIINWHPARVPRGMWNLEAIKSSGSKVILLIENSEERLTFDQRQAVEQVDAAVAHEDVGDPAVTFIPVGLNPGPGDIYTREFSVGTAGFVFPWKRFDLVVEVAEALGWDARIVAPPHQSSRDLPAQIADWRGRLGERLKLIDSLVPVQEVIAHLARSTVNVFYFDSRGEDDLLGQSGSARMGIAARRPMIVSRHRKLRTILAGYENEFYIADRPGEIGHICLDIAGGIRRGESVRKPARIFEDQGWTAVGRRWRELIREVVSRR